MSNKFPDQNQPSHESLYGGKHKGDTWTLSENFDKNPRGAAIQFIRNKFSGPISVLDIGCGKGVNTMWVAKDDVQSNWVGVDAVAPDKIGIQIPVENKNVAFVQGDFLHDDSLSAKNLELQQQFEIVVDQGAAFVEIDDEVVMSKYLAKIARYLKTGGYFIALTVEGKHGTTIWPDGRKRVFHDLSDFEKVPFSEYFEVEKVTGNFGYSYLPEDAALPHVKNPMGAKTGDERQVVMVHIFFKKK